jgi:hypothetical protein
MRSSGMRTPCSIALSPESLPISSWRAPAGDMGELDDRTIRSVCDARSSGEPVVAESGER